MGFLLFCARQQQLIVKKNQLNAKLLQIQQTRMEYQNYAASLGNGYVTTNDLTQASGSVFGRMQAFSQQSTAGAMQYSQQNINAVMANSNVSQMSADQQAQYRAQMQQQLFTQARASYVEQEKTKLNEIDKKLEQDQTTVQNQLSLESAEEEKLQSAIDDAAKKTAPKFTA